MSQRSIHSLGNLRTIRESLGWPVADLAAAIAITPTSLHRHERGERRIFLDKARMLADVMGVPVDWLGTVPLTDEQLLNLFKRGEQRRQMQVLSNAPRPVPTPELLQEDNSDHVHVSSKPEPKSLDVINQDEDPELAGLTDEEKIKRLIADWDLSGTGAE